MDNELEQQKNQTCITLITAKVWFHRCFLYLFAIAFIYMVVWSLYAQRYISMENEKIMKVKRIQPLGVTTKSVETKKKLPLKYMYKTIQKLKHKMKKKSKADIEKLQPLGVVPLNADPQTNLEPARFYASPVCPNGSKPVSNPNLIEQMIWTKWNDKPKNQPRIPIIYYDYFNHRKDFNHCKYQCVYTTEVSMYEKADVAVFTFMPLEKIFQKNASAIWAFESGESPFHMPHIPLHLSSKFGLILTSHSDADVMYAYGSFRAFNKPSCSLKADFLTGDYRKYLPKLHAVRTKLVAWVVSNLGPRNRRNEIAKELQKHVEVDIYGRANIECGANCFEDIKRKYKFYLSFENSNCKDYITEKFYGNALGNGLVPIVYGAAYNDYLKFAPPHSFIHVSEFKDMQQLGEYLRYLDKNDTALATYHAWRAYGTVENEMHIHCRLCGHTYAILAGQAKPHRHTFQEVISRDQCQSFNI